MREKSKINLIKKEFEQLNDNQINYRLRKLKINGFCFSPRRGTYHKLVNPIKPTSSEQTRVF